MCGRYRLSRRKQVVEEHFAASGEEDWGCALGLQQWLLRFYSRTRSSQTLVILLHAVLPHFSHDQFPNLRQGLRGVLNQQAL